MHHIYTTSAFVIHSASHGEAGKFLLLFTRDFGMIGATAQGIRLIKSKLRYHIQDFNFSTVSIVRGKEIWRLTGAHEIAHMKNNIVHLRILKLLKRLLHGEEKNENLFEIIEELFNTEIKEKDFENVECLTVFRIMHILGYIDKKGELSSILETFVINDEMLKSIQKNKAKIVKMINKALSESQL